MSLEGPLYHQPQFPSETQPNPLDRSFAEGLDHSPAFYHRTSRAVVAVSGHEVGTSDFHSAVDMLNTRLKLGLCDIDCRAFSFMLTCLSKSCRFGGEFHIDPTHGENSAAHSCHAVVLAQEIFRRAGLLAPDRLTPEVDALRRNITIGCLIHDMGEILGEFSSVAQRSTDHTLEELPDIEREIFRITLTEAYRTASADPSDPSGFESFIGELREAAGLGKKGISDTSPEHIAAVLREHPRIQESRAASPEVLGAVEAALRLYDMAELKKNISDPLPIFIGNAVKVVEHVQGLRHFLRFAHVAPNQRRVHLFSPETHLELEGDLPRPAPAQSAIPLRYASSKRFLSNVKYIEKELPHVFSSSSTPDEKALARALRDLAYQSQIEWFSISRPFVDRTVMQESPKLVAAQKRLAETSSDDDRAQILAEIEDHLRVQLDHDGPLFFRAEAEGAEDTAAVSKLLPIESSSRLAQLYAEALRIEFEPTSETPLMLLEEIPSELRGFLSRRAEPDEAPGPFDDLSMPPPQA